MLLQTKGCARIMTVAPPKRIWTGDRLDGLEKKVDDGFAQVDARFEKLEGKIEARFDSLDERFNHLIWGLFSAAVVIIAPLIAL